MLSQMVEKLPSPRAGKRGNRLVCVVQYQGCCSTVYGTVYGKYGTVR